MKILVTGANGQLGSDVVKELKSRGLECIKAEKTTFDITDEKETRNFILNTKPDAVIHCAAYTTVDLAEDEWDLCKSINAKGTENLAKACNEIDAKMLYISTDYVFSGQGDTPYEPNAVTSPLNNYGKSKRLGEKAVLEVCEKSFVIRTSWVFGLNGKNFVKTIINLSKQNDKINVVDDQIGSPTYTVDLAKLISDIIMTDKYGIYHATNEGYCSFAEFAKEILRAYGSNTVINPIKSEEYKAKATRPKNSRLSKKCLDDNGFSRLPDWHDALNRFIPSLNI